MVPAMWRDRAARNTALVMVAAVACYAVLAWQRRWISDDGLIAVRTARNVVAGNGPVFNAFERAEANTSTLWTYVMALVGFVTHVDMTRIAVFVGLVLAVVGVAIGLDAARRWRRGRGETGLLVPCGVLVWLGTAAAWDYATSGLETGLTFAWIAVAWWLLVALRPDSPRPGLTAFVFGLGPMVRPDLAVASGVFLLALWWLIRPPWRRTLVLAGYAIALPLAYEIFRAGYYGILVPLPALAKSAASAEWGRGLLYLRDLMRPNLLWLPLAAVVAMIVALRPRGRDLVIVGAPLAAALVDAIYVVRVGGDFMHARLLLPAVFLVLLPVFVVPATPRLAVAAGAIAVWAVVMWHAASPRRSQATAGTVEDERYGYVLYTQREHPDDNAAYLDHNPMTPVVVAALRAHRPLFLTEGGVELPLDPHAPARLALVMGRLGTGGVLAPLDGFVVDTLGLANPIGARIPVNHPENRVGHRKVLEGTWILADLGDPARIAETSEAPARVAAARHALGCGELAELMASVREPMSIGRFWHNLIGSLRRTRLVIPGDPAEAERAFCGASRLPVVTTSSSYEQWGWGRAELADGRRVSTYGHLGFSSAITNPQDHTEWIEVALAPPLTGTQLVLYPRTDVPGAGFPIDFSIEAWDGSQWVRRVERQGYATPTTPQTFDLGAPAARVRLVATHLPDVAGQHVLQLAEIELVP